jgi:hypothetical protein
MPWSDTANLSRQRSNKAQERWARNKRIFNDLRHVGETNKRITLE